MRKLSSHDYRAFDEKSITDITIVQELRLPGFLMTALITSVPNKQYVNFILVFFLSENKTN